MKRVLSGNYRRCPSSATFEDATLVKLQQVRDSTCAHASSEQTEVKDPTFEQICIFIFLCLILEKHTLM